MSPVQIGRHKRFTSTLRFLASFSPSFILCACATLAASPTRPDRARGGVRPFRSTVVARKRRPLACETRQTGQHVSPCSHSLGLCRSPSLTLRLSLPSLPDCHLSLSREVNPRRYKRLGHSLDRLSALLLGYRASVSVSDARSRLCDFHAEMSS
ncbi:unnamed protein product [Protopolystoma xenopodis]|uniref:Secreted protein n=1 Tax=Protopolystoma xenopodis TaxID=117903 RepID=A0A448X8P2_9PLAT|nr:unnamed protein product [Protopolystoma xenopodis]